MKTRLLKRIILITICLGICFVNKSFPQESKQLYQKGLQKEEGEGNLKEAITIYEKVVEDKSAERIVRANALMHIGLCYEKLGNKEAQKAYQRLISDFADQGDLVAMARKKLNSLISVKTSNVLNKPIVRQVWSPAQGDAMGRISPDGRYLSFVNWNTIEIAVRDLKTEEMWDLTNIGTWEAPIQFPDGSIWSPDSKKIAYYWIRRGENAAHELHIVNKDGSEDHILAKGKMNLTPYPMDWSPDGNYIIGVRGGNFPSDSGIKGEVVLVNVETGSIQGLKTMKDKLITHLSFSPDGKYIVGDFSQEEGSKQKDIVLIQLDGGPEINLVQHLADDSSPYWVPGSNQIVFVSDRTGSKGLWIVEFFGEDTHSVPKMIKGELEETFKMMGITNNGTICYATTSQPTDIFLTSVDFDSGKVINAPEKLSIDNPGKNLKPRWSPDGKKLAYLELKESSDPNKPYVKFVIKKISTGETQVIEPDLTGPVRNYWFDYQWFPDGQSFLTTGINENNQIGLYKINIVSENITPILTSQIDKGNPRSTGYFPQLSPDGEIVYYEGSDLKSIISRNMSTGSEKTVCQIDEQINKFLLSPDGKTIVLTYSFNNTNSLYKVSSSGGKIKKMLTLDDESNLRLISWNSDSRIIYFLPRNRSAVFSAVVSSGKIKKIFDSKALFSEVTDLDLHHDGNTFAVTMKTGKGLEIWAMENFLPEK